MPAFFLVDFGETTDSEGSVLTKIIGDTDHIVGISNTLFAVCAAVAIVAYCWLLVLLLVGWRQRKRADEAAEPVRPR